MKVAIMGFGIVGSGVAQVLNDLGHSDCGRRAALPLLSYIIDPRKLPEDSPYTRFQVRDLQTALRDSELGIVAETIGGTHIAYQLTREALTAGRSVVTSNKALVAAHGQELLALAHENGVRYLFEASVGGGMPILHPLKYCLEANTISAVAGVLNGTTNYIIERMENAACSFETALKEAQMKGYAERDPCADVDGLDAARKLAILCSVSDGRFYPADGGLIEGIRELRPDYFTLARATGYVLRLLALAEKDADGRLGMRTALHLLPERHPLAMARGVMNAVLVTGSAVGDTLFYGPGAGSLATASAVVADIIEASQPLYADGAEIWSDCPKDALIEAEELPVKALIAPLSQTPSPAQLRLLEGMGARSLKGVGRLGAFEIGVRRVVREGELAVLKTQLRQAGDWAALRIYRRTEEEV